MATPVIVQNLQTAFNVESFDITKSSWSRWVDRLETSFEIFGCEEPKKLNLLLHYMGQETYNVLCDKIAPQKPTTKTYKEVVETLQEYYDPVPLEIVENYRFHLRKQHEGEPAEEFMVALRKLSIHCNFGNYLETALRNQFVFGLRNQKIQNRLLEVKQLTMKAAVDTTSSMELSERGGAEFHVKKEAVNQMNFKLKKKTTNSTNKTEKPKKVKHDNNSSKVRQTKCYRCGSEAHLANQCFHKNTECLYCKKVGHLKKVCLKAKNKNKDSGTITTNHIEELCHVIDISNKTKFCTRLKINNIFLEFEIDTGSPVTLINQADVRKIFGKLPLQPSDRELISYCNTKIRVLGFANVLVGSGTDMLNLRLYVVDSNKNPLLGREWITKLSLDWNKVFNNKECTDLLKIDSNKKIPEGIEMLIKKYANVFEESAGKIKNILARIKVKTNCTPVFIKARRVPFSLKNIVENELDELVANDILEKVETSEWATPIVPVRKSDNRVRICGDYKITVNPNLIVDEHPLPTIDEMFATMAGGKKYTKLDLTKAYLQMEVHPDDREILTLSTHKGLFRPKRLMYGIASGPAKWQKEIEYILKDIDGVTVFIDDIKITAEDDTTHLKRLEEVLKRLSEYNMRINLNKSEFMADQIEYCGYIIDKDGIHKMKQKVEAIQNMRRPENKDEIRAFVGLVNYYGRFLQNLSTILYPINNLLKDVPFNWNEDCERSFREVKRQMQSEVVLVHYDTKLPLVLATDASPYGVGAVLSHIYPDGTERPIQYASQTLSPVQQKYSQIDREAYAIVFGIKRFYQYVYARKFILITDNKPIMQILSPQRGLPALSATRMQHYAIMLESFDYEIQYRKSKEHSNVDAMSRLPVKDKYANIEEIDVIEINAIETLPLTVKELGEATKNDDEVALLRKALREGRTCDANDRFGIDQKEFSLQQDCLLRNIRVYIPTPLRKRVLDELHSTHFGMSRMKSLARSYCWWRNIDKDIEALVLNCTNCQTVRADPQKVPIHCWEMPTKPFERVHADFAGPFMGQYFFILVDAYSKWPEVHIIPNITSETTIRKCREIFSTFGIPSVFVSDHGRQFTSHEFQRFLKMNGIVHKMGAPYHPATNGQAERYVQTIKRKLEALKCSKTELPKELSNVLLSYRKTLHPSTGKSPSLLIFGRQIRSRMDLMTPIEEKQTNTELKMIPKFNIGERVAARDYITNEKWKFGNIIKIVGNLHFLVRLDDSRIWTRHTDQLRKVGPLVSVATQSYDDAVPIDNMILEESQNTYKHQNILPNTQEVSKPRQEAKTTTPIKLTVTEESSITENTENDEAEGTGLRRSTRLRQAPSRLAYK